MARRSPFDSYVAPSVILLVAVAGGMTVAASALIVRHKRAAEISIGAGLVLLGWIVVQVLIIPFSWLQPAFFAGGLVVVALGWRLRNRGVFSEPAVRGSTATSRAPVAVMTSVRLAFASLAAFLCRPLFARSMPVRQRVGAGAAGKVGKETVATPWGDWFSDYEVAGGVRIPTRTEVYWDLPEGRFTYFRGTVTALELG